RRAQRDLVAVEERVLVHSLAADVGPVQRAQIAKQEFAFGCALYLRVFFGDDPVEDLDRVLRVPSDGIEALELELLAVVGRDEDQLGHALLVQGTGRIRCMCMTVGLSKLPRLCSTTTSYRAWISR